MAYNLKGSLGRKDVSAPPPPAGRLMVPTHPVAPPHQTSRATTKGTAGGKSGVPCCSGVGGPSSGPPQGG